MTAQCLYMVETSFEFQKMEFLGGEFQIFVLGFILYAIKI
jgi:hypothetical protein